MPSIWFPNLNIKIYNLSKTAVTIFNFSVQWYALAILTGIVLGLLAVKYNCEKENEDFNIYFDYFFYGYIVAIISARIYFVAFKWEYYKNDLMSVFKIYEGGIAIYGAIIGAVITAIVFTKLKKIKLPNFLDFLVLGLPIGQAVGRWGNFVNREAYGGFTDSFFKMRILKNEGTKLTEDILNNIVTVQGYEYIQVHPTFLYESLLNLANFIFLMIYFKKRKFEGEVFLLYFLIYGIGRYIIEGLRVDQLVISNSNIAISQLISLLFIGFSLIFIVIGRKGKR